MKPVIKDGITETENEYAAAYSARGLPTTVALFGQIHKGTLVCVEHSHYEVNGIQFLPTSVRLWIANRQIAESMISAKPTPKDCIMGEGI